MKLSKERRVAPVARCEVCNQILTREDAVTEKVVKTSRALYHTHHFKCFFCCCDLAGVEYAEQNKRILCIDCHEDKNLPKCFGCQLTIFDEATDFSGKLYHYDCIKCFYCFNPLPNGEYYLVPNVEKKKIPADEDCYMTSKYKIPLTDSI